MNKEQFQKNHVFTRTKHLQDIIYIALFTALIAVSAQISIPTTIPFTLQTLGVFLAGAMLGGKRGSISVIIYLLIALTGIPVLANFSGGFDKVIGITGGYLIGFVFIALIVGFATDKFGRKIVVLILSMILGVLVCYLFGTVWFCVLTKTPFVDALMICVVPYLLFDGLKIVLATVLVNRLDKIVKL